MTAVNAAARDLAIFVPDGCGGYRTPTFERDLGNGYVAAGGQMTSAEGYRSIRQHARLFEETRAAFEALEGRLGTCEHGASIDELVEEGSLRWSINDYICDPAGRPESVVWMLWGSHPDSGEWCWPLAFFRGLVLPYDAGMGAIRPLLDSWESSNVVELETGVLLDA